MTTKQNSKEALAFLMVGDRIARAIYTITKLSIPDIIGDALVSVDALAKKTKVSCDALYRVMRMLVGFDIFNEKKPHYFENTELSFYLTKDHPDSFRNSVIYRIELGSEAWDNLLYSIKTGKPAFEKKFGMPFFQYLSEHPAKSEVFNKGMAAQSRKTFHNILDGYDFSFCNTLVDVGGGRGYFAAEFLKRYSKAKVILFDLPSALNEFDSSTYSKNMLSRLTLHAGDFFKSVPSGGDVYFLKTIIHDWSDEQAIKIIKNISKKMKPNGRLLLVETVVPDKNCKDYTFLMDLQMLVQFGGRERTKKEYELLFKRAGYILNKIYDLPGVFKIIEARLA